MIGRILIAIGLFLFGAIALTSLPAFGTTEPLTQAAASNLARACRYAGTTAVVATSAAASTPTQWHSGVVRIVCTQDVHLKEAAASTNAVSTDMLIKGNIETFVWSKKDFLSFIQDSAGGNCYVSECL